MTMWLRATAAAVRQMWVQRSDAWTV